MQRKYDFLNIRDQRTFNSQRALLSANVMYFSASNEKTEIQLIITKSMIYMEYQEAVLRKIATSDIEAFTVSNASSEFVLHVTDDEDERLASYEHRNEILEMLLYLLTVRNNMFIDSSVKIPFYYVDDINLDLYVTTEEDLEDGHTIRPEGRYLLYLNYNDFLENLEQRKESKIRQRNNTKTIYAKSNKKVSIEDFELLKLLGKGAHGKVLLCEKKTGSRGLFAMKVLKKQHIIESNQLEHTKAEKIILSHANHPFLVSLQYAFQTEEKLYFVMEFMRGGELFQHLQRVKQFTETETKHIAACIVLALGHLHNKDYIYRDLKPENVLMDRDGYCKLTDFGLAKFLKDSDLTKTFCGTPEYLAPEVILDKGCNRPVDWWSLGILVYEMIYGIPPFYSTNVQKMYKNIVMNELKFKKHTQCSEEAKNFMRGLLVKKPQNRLGSSADSLELMSHPWFKDIDWSKLLEKKLIMPFRPLKPGEDWEHNFDPLFTKQRATDSIGWIDPKLVELYRKDFEEFDYEPETIDTETERKKPFIVNKSIEDDSRLIELGFSDCDSLNNQISVKKNSSFSEGDMHSNTYSFNKKDSRKRVESRSSSSSTSRK